MNVRHHVVNPALRSPRLSRRSGGHRRESRSAVIGIGFALIVAAVIGSMWLMRSTLYDTWGVLVTGPILVLVSLPILAREARRESNPVLFWVLLAALLIKLFGGVARFYIEAEVYGGLSDSAGYHHAGLEIAGQIRAGDFGDAFALSGTRFIRYFTGLVYAAFGTSRLGGFVVYSWIGFWGLFLFRRAFRIAMPHGDLRFYTVLLFFLPSLVLYSSGTGKDPWMVLALGIAAYGAARAIADSMPRGLLLTVVGLWMASMVRPHVAAAFVVAFATAHLLRRSPARLGELKPFAKLASVAVLVVMVAPVLSNAFDFLERAGLDSEKGLGAALTLTADRTGYGGSEFKAVVLDSPVKVPAAVATVLFRPTPFEARNLQALIAAAEGALLILLTVFRWKSIARALRASRTYPYAVLAVAFVGAMIVVLSSLANFGLLVRQRVSLMPLFLVLLAVSRTKPASELLSEKGPS